MADEAEAKPSSGPGLKRFIKPAVMGLAAILILGGGGYFGFKFFKGWRARKAAAQAAAQLEPPRDPDEIYDEEQAAPGGEGKAATPAILVLKPIVNLEGPHKNSYLKCELHLIFRDPELGREAAAEKPTPENSEIRAMVLELLSGKTVEDVSDTETREAIRVEIKDRLNERFKPKPLKPGEKEDKSHKRPIKPIKDVLVVDWAIQQ